MIKQTAKLTIKAFSFNVVLAFSAGANSLFIDNVTVFDSTGAEPFVADVIVKVKL